MYDYIVFMDDDDIYGNNSVLQRIIMLMKQPSRGCVFSTTIPCYDISKYSMSPEPTLSNVDDSASASSDITIIVQKSFTCQPFSNVIEFHLVAEYIFNSRLSIDIINRYIIFIWDPGISFTMYHFIPILRFPR